MEWSNEHLEDAVKIAYAMGQRDTIVAIGQSLGDLVRGREVPDPEEMARLLRETHGLLGPESPG